MTEVSGLRLEVLSTASVRPLYSVSARQQAANKWGVRFNIQSACAVWCVQVGATQERLDDDEREIKRLERLLRINKRKDKNKLPASFTREGLDCILRFLFVPLSLLCVL